MMAGWARERGIGRLGVGGGSKSDSDLETPSLNAEALLRDGDKGGVLSPGLGRVLLVCRLGWAAAAATQARRRSRRPVTVEPGVA